MRSPPGGLLVLGQAYIYHRALINDLRSDSNPWRSGRSDTPAPIRLLESVTVPEGSGRGRPARVCTKMTKRSVFNRNRRKPGERFVKAPLVQYTVY